MSFIKNFIALIFLAWHAHTLYAQDIRFKRITNNDNLSDNTVETVLQDYRGFLWFGTRDGLNRYDGYQMVVYKNQKADSLSLSSNNIRKIYQDHKSRLWVATADGLNLYHEELDIFSRFNLVESNAQIANNFVTSICQNKQKQILIGTFTGILVFNEEKQSLDRYKIMANGREVPFKEKVTYLFEDIASNIWIGTEGNGLFVIEDNNLRHIVEGGPEGLCSDNILTISQDLSHNIWVGTDKGISVRRNGSRQFSHYRSEVAHKNTLSSNVIKCIQTSREGKVWVGTENGGISVYDPVQNAFTRYENNPSDPFSLSQKTVLSLCEDTQGNIWIGTLKGGVDAYIPQTQQFDLYTQGLTDKNLSYKDVKAFLEAPNGDIYIGTDGGGLNIWDRRHNRFKYFKHKTGDERSIGSDAVLHLTQDADSEVWIGTWGGGFNHFSPKKETFKSYKHDRKNPESLNADNAWVVYEDRGRNLWVGTSPFGGLNLFNKKEGTFSRPYTNILSADIGVHALLEDPEGNLWVGTYNHGLYSYDKRKGTLDQYLVVQNQLPETVNVLFLDSKNRVWIGQRGLYYFDRQKKQVVPVPPLKDDVVQSIEEDHTGNLWISTHNGIVRYHPEHLTYKRFTVGDGLQGAEFGPKASLKTSKGELLFGGSNGFNIFYPDSIRTNTTPPPVYLIGLYLSNMRVEPNAKNSPLKKSIHMAEEIVLEYEQSAFSIEYVALNYIASDQNEYAYMLEGFDKDWHYVDDVRKCAYTNLSPGQYVFKVKASNNDGVWNEEGASIKVIVKAPFWMTWWFRTLIFLLIVGILLFVYKYMKERVLDKKKEELRQMQLQFFTNISHEFRTPLTFIQGSVEQLKELHHENKYFRLIEKNTHRMTSLINELMNFRKVESGSLQLHVEEVNLNQFIAHLTEDFKVLSEQRNIRFSVTYPSKNKAVWIDKNVVEKILFNLLNNALKYTDEGCSVSLDVSFAKAAIKSEKTLIHRYRSKYKGRKHLFFKISDTGIGISPDSGKNLFQSFFRISDRYSGSGIGLAFVKSLVTLHRGYIDVFSEKGTGSDFIIALPYHKHDFKSQDIAHAPLRSIEQTSHDENGESIPSLSNTVKEKRILLVDDDEDLRHFIREALEKDYFVEEAQNGVHALKLLDNILPDLIISDVMMPYMDGVTFCREVRRRDDLKHVPFLMLTAKTNVEAQLEGMEQGADYYLAKPFSLKALQLTLRNIFERNQSLKLFYLKDYQSEIRQNIHSVQSKEFIDQLLCIIEGMLEEPELNVDYISKKMGMSKTKLYNTIKSITGQNITDFIRTLRLKKAAYIMVHEDVTIAEVMSRVGIQSSSYFASIFKKEFGKNPSQYLKDLSSKK